MTAKDFAVVTGGSAGIGAEICRQMLERGYEVISLALHKPAQSHARLHALEVWIAQRPSAPPPISLLAFRFRTSCTTPG